MPMPTKPFLSNVKRETDVRMKNWLSGHSLFANRPAVNTVSSLPSDRQLTPNCGRLQMPSKGFKLTTPLSSMFSARVRAPSTGIKKNPNTGGFIAVTQSLVWFIGV